MHMRIEEEMGIAIRIGRADSRDGFGIDSVDQVRLGPIARELVDLVWASAYFRPLGLGCGVLIRGEHLLTFSQ